MSWEEYDWYKTFLARVSGNAGVFEQPLCMVTEECIGCSFCIRVYAAGCAFMKAHRAVNTMENSHMWYGMYPLIPGKCCPAYYAGNNAHIRLTKIVAANEQGKA